MSNTTENTEPASLPPLWRRLAIRLRRRKRVLGAALAGSVIAASAVAWQTNLPSSDDERACWGALSDEDVAELTELALASEDEADPVAEEQAPMMSAGEFYGSCLIRGGDLPVNVRFHQPAAFDSTQITDDVQWASRFLSASMTWLGGELTGMASPSEAWLALPDACTETGGPFPEGPAIVEMIRGPHPRFLGGFQSFYQSPQEANAARDLMASTITRIANAVMAELDCETTLAEPVDLPEVPTTSVFRPDELCDIPGLSLPQRYRGLTFDPPRQRMSIGDSPIRVCEIADPSHYEDSQTRFRLATIDDPSISEILLTPDFNQGGKPLRSESGSGTVNGHLAVFRAACHHSDESDTDVAFLLQFKGNRFQYDLATTGAVLRDYVAAEAERLDCNPLDIRLPR